MRKERLYSNHNQINGSCRQFGEWRTSQGEDRAAALARVPAVNLRIFPQIAKKFPPIFERQEQKA
jgi:hypothetical protein